MQPKILLVEDDRIVQKVHYKLLERLRCVVDIANDGRQALTFYQQNKYDIIFLDAGLPYISGFELAKIIRTQEPNDRHQPLIMLSAYLHDEVKTHSESSGIDAFAIKPITQKIFQELLSTWIIPFSKSTHFSPLPLAGEGAEGG